MSDFLQVSTVADGKETATHLARSAVAARFAASAQIIGPVMSVYWHLGEIGEGEEWQVILKTTASRYPELREHLKTEHSWDNPEITAVALIDGTENYFAWLRRTVDPTG